MDADPVQESFIADLEEQGQRIDRVIAQRLPALSRSRIQTLIDLGRIAVDGTTISACSQKVRAGQTLVIGIPPLQDDTPEPQAIPLTVLFEDDHLVVIDKPAGMVVHPAPGSHDQTLVNALLAHCGDNLAGIGGVKRPGIVHRLDKDTTGLMVVAKSDLAHAALSADFAARRIERAYHALVWGAPMPGAGQIDAAIGRSPHDRKKMAVVATGGRSAITNYQILARYGVGSPGVEDNPVAALIQCRLMTGRTHQIRVHLAHIGHPVIGDPIYGHKTGLKARAARGRLKAVPEGTASLLAEFSRQALHARLLGFKHPLTGELLRFTVSPPADFADLQRSLELL